MRAMLYGLAGVTASEAKGCRGLVRWQGVGNGQHVATVVHGSVIRGNNGNGVYMEQVCKFSNGWRKLRNVWGRAMSMRAWIELW